MQQRDAFVDGIVELRPRLMRYARSLMKHREEAEDLVSNVVVTALRKRRLWEEGTDLRAWLFTIMHNTAINEWRHLKRHANLSGEILVPPPTVDPEVHTMAEDVVRAMEDLSPDQREIVRLIAINGMKYEEASQALGILVGTVRSRLARARAALREAVDR